jgi:DNA polymerase elongation subunit (family B)
MSDMKILTLDIETAPNLVYVWGLWNQNVSIESIVEPTYMLSWAAKWYGKKKIYYRDCYADDFLTKIHEMMEEADAIVTWNGISFDIKHLNREFIEAGMTPPFVAKDLDLVRTARKRFKWPSNKLDYVAGRLLNEQKDDVPYRLWLDCMNGVKSAWAKMKKYNKRDVEITEKVYTVLRPWIIGHPNHGLYVEDQDNPICRACGSAHVHSKGWQATNVRGYQRYKCQDCGWSGRGRNMIKGGKNSPQVIT